MYVGLETGSSSLWLEGPRVVSLVFFIEKHMVKLERLYG